MTLTVDPDRCEGTGYCARISGRLFTLEDGPPAKVLMANPTGADADDAAEAETLCPTRAIAFTDTTSDDPEHART